MTTSTVSSRSTGRTCGGGGMCGRFPLARAYSITIGGSISSAGDSHVNRSALQASERAMMMNDGSGLKCVEFARLSNLDGSWLKTSQGFSQLMLDGSSEEWLETWPRSGMMSNGIAYRLPPLVPRISGTGSSSLRVPTPSASGFECQDAERMLERRAECKEKHRNGNGFGLTLGQYVRMFPTPTARDYKSGKASQATHDRNSRPLSEQIGGTLNPRWVEWLMGFPLGWTDLKDLGTPSCPK